MVPTLRKVGIPAFAARKQGKTRGAIGFSLSRLLSGWLLFLSSQKKEQNSLEVNNLIAKSH
jgi:hypothetical protein